MADEIVSRSCETQGTQRMRHPLPGNLDVIVAARLVRTHDADGQAASEVASLNRWEML